MKQIPWPKFSFALIPLVPFLFFIAAVNKYAVNIPWMDDYDAILQEVCRFTHTASIKEKWEVLIAQHTDHRILWTKLVGIIYYRIFGDINFKNLILIGNLQLLVTGITISWFIQQYGGNRWPFASLLVSICIFDFNTYENNIWALGSLQNYGILMWFSLSLLFASKRMIVPAILTMSMCILSSGNGAAAAFFVIVYSILLRPKEMWKNASLLLTWIACTTVFFINYQMNSDPNKLPFDLTRTIVFGIKELGSHFDFDLSILFGMGILILAAFTYKKSVIIKKEAWPLLAIVAFCLSSILLMAIMRGNTPGVLPQTSRYLIYPELISGLTFMFFLSNTNTRMATWIMVFILVGGIYFKNRKYGIAGYERTITRISTLKYYHPAPATCEEITKMACKDEIYCIEENR